MLVVSYGIFHWRRRKIMALTPSKARAERAMESGQVLWRALCVSAALLSAAPASADLLEVDAAGTTGMNAGTYGGLQTSPGPGCPMISALGFGCTFVNEPFTSTFLFD